MSNRFEERNVGRVNLSVKVVNVVAGADDIEILAAPGAGKRYRVYGVVITQQGTAAADFLVRFEDNKDVLGAIVPNDGTPVTDKLNGQYVEGDTNQGLDVDVENQASDDATIVVYHTVEED